MPSSVGLHARRPYFGAKIRFQSMSDMLSVDICSKEACSNGYYNNTRGLISLFGRESYAVIPFLEKDTAMVKKDTRSVLFGRNGVS